MRLVVTVEQGHIHRQRRMQLYLHLDVQVVVTLNRHLVGAVGREGHIQLDGLGRQQLVQHVGVEGHKDAAHPRCRCLAHAGISRYSLRVGSIDHAVVEQRADLLVVLVTEGGVQEDVQRNSVIELEHEAVQRVERQGDVVVVQLLLDLVHHFAQRLAVISVLRRLVHVDRVVEGHVVDLHLERQAQVEVGVILQPRHLKGFQQGREAVGMQRVGHDAVVDRVLHVEVHMAAGHNLLRAVVDNRRQVHIHERHAVARHNVVDDQRVGQLGVAVEIRRVGLVRLEILNLQAVERDRGVLTQILVGGLVGATSAHLHLQRQHHVGDLHVDILHLVEDIHRDLIADHRIDQPDQRV